MIHFSTEGDIARIILDNGRLNILTREMHRQLYGVLLRFLRDDALKVAILGCRPGTSFSAGDDLKTVDEPYGSEPDWEELTMMLPRNKPIVGAVRGHCIGQGIVYLLLLTDIRYCDTGARFGLPEIRHGMGGAGALASLSRHIPPAIASYMLLTGESIDAEQAKQSFLVNDVLAVDELDDKALETARQIATHPLVALQMELWPGRPEVQQRLGQIAQFSTLWDLQRRVHLKK